MSSAQPGSTILLQSRRPSSDAAIPGAVPQSVQRQSTLTGSRVQSPLRSTSTSLVTSPAQLPSSSNGPSLQPTSLPPSRQVALRTPRLPAETTHGLRTFWKDLCTTANILAVLALLVGFTFGVATTRQTGVQNVQTQKSYELDLWNTCADHEAIQNTTTCRRVLSQSFDRFQKRGLKDFDPEIALRIREIIDNRNTLEVSPDMDGLYNTPIERWLSKFAVSEAERALIFSTDRDGRLEFPEVRALVFPLAELLYLPIKWTLSVIEALLVAVTYTIRTLFRWAGVVLWFLFQISLYTAAEYAVKLVLAGFDELIMQVMPSWMPPFVVAGTGTGIGVAALKSYWYSISFWECLKWNFGLRLGLWVAWNVVVGGFRLYGEWRDRTKRRH